MPFILCFTDYRTLLRCYVVFVVVSVLFLTNIGELQSLRQYLKIFLKDLLRGNVINYLGFNKSISMAALSRRILGAIPWQSSD